jgi:hypothetical protein
MPTVGFDDRRIVEVWYGLSRSRGIAKRVHGVDRVCKVRKAWAEVDGSRAHNLEQAILGRTHLAVVVSQFSKGAGTVAIEGARARCGLRAVVDVICRREHAACWQCCLLCNGFLEWRCVVFGALRA